ncbi:MAG: L-cystine transporter [SAR86 cluster bacterium]|uniref:L-cystine transporter n=1 Tax=SAR86 cluster bacterium TaxID=2030880 RepID=A0A2A5CH64_9GAMM|nr:MAG: L-cystine transporter [SAR86 cluster bacterium]
MNLMVLINLVLFASLIYVLIGMTGKGFSLGQRVFTALMLGIAFGILLQLFYQSSPDVISDTLEWSNVVGTAYVSLLRMIVMPLILVSILAAVIKLSDLANLGKISISVIGLLLFTTMLAAIVGIVVSLVFGLSADGLIQGARELARAEVLLDRQAGLSTMSFPDLIGSFLPQNIFSDLAGLRDTSVIAVVIFSIILGIAGLKMTKDDAEKGAAFRGFIDVSQTLVLKLVRLVIALTPYGVLALMFNVAASSDFGDILDLLSFILASYLAILVMFVIHGGLLFLFKVNPIDYFKKIMPVLAFAFTSRSSMATIPLNVETQINELGNSPVVANFSASFGSTIGQNGCAGIYPAMLAVMIAPSMGVDPASLGFIVMLVAIVTISSLGVAGVGGGATFAALMVLPALGFPVVLVALLISIEPLIDMARTALNVSGAMTAGTITSRLLESHEHKQLEEAGANE